MHDEDGMLRWWLSTDLVLCIVGDLDILGRWFSECALVLPFFTAFPVDDGCHFNLDVTGGAWVSHLRAITQR